LAWKSFLVLERACFLGKESQLSWKRKPIGWPKLGKAMQEPEGPPNKKGRPFGHGTTSHARRERRAHMQWSALEKDDPASSQCLVKHLAALEKAQKKCQEKLATSLAQSLAKEGGGGFQTSWKRWEPQEGSPHPSRSWRAGQLLQLWLEKAREEEGQQVRLGKVD